jgi:hypothetical protein
LKKGQEKAKWPNQYISRKLLQKRPNKADYAFLKAKWQPCFLEICTAAHGQRNDKMTKEKIALSNFMFYCFYIP